MNQSSNVSSALMTERQFMPQPQNPYVKNLISLSAHPVSANPDNNDGLLLSHALGVLGDSIAAEGVAQQKRKEQIGIAEAERIVSQRSEDDMHKLNAVDMLNTYGNFDLADNPYAISTIEKMRGKYFGARAKNEYQSEVIDKDGYVKSSPEDEVARYNQFVQDKYGDSIGTSSDTQAFQKGFYDNHVVDQLDVANSQIKAKSQEMRVVLLGTTQADLSKVVEDAFSLPPGGATDKVNEIFANTRLAGLTPTERVRLWKSFSDEYAQKVGDAGRLKSMAENVTLGVDSTGKPMKASDVYDMTDTLKTAEVRKGQMFESDVSGAVDKLKNGTKDEVNLYYDNLKQNDPHMFNTMLPFKVSIINHIDAVEAKRKAMEQRATNEAHAIAQANQVLKNQFSAYLAGNTLDAQGNPVASSHGDLPKFQYTAYDVNGNPTAKQYEWRQGDVTGFVNNQAAYIMQSVSDPTERAKELMKLYSWPPAKIMADTLKMQYGGAINGLTPDRLGTDANGGAVITGQAKNAIDMYNADPEAFVQIFGSDITSSVEAIQVLSQATDDVSEGVAAFANARDKIRNDPEFVKKVKADVSAALDKTAMDGFLGIDGNPSNINQKLSANESLMKRIRQLTEYLVLGGQTVQNATEIAKQKARATHYVWGDTAFPRTIFNGINTSNKAAIGKEVLEYYRQDYINTSGVDPMYITVHWNDDRNLLRISGGTAAPRNYTPNDIAYSGNVILKQRAESAKDNPGRNVESVDEVPPNPAYHDATNDLPEGTYWGV